MLDAQGDVYADLAEVLVLAAPAEEAAALEQALDATSARGTSSLAAAHAGATRRAPRDAAPR